MKDGRWENEEGNEEEVEEKVEGEDGRREKGESRRSRCIENKGEKVGRES